jgi:hypothetical protein
MYRASGTVLLFLTREAITLSLDSDRALATRAATPFAFFINGTSLAWDWNI